MSVLATRMCLTDLQPQGGSCALKLIVIFAQKSGFPWTVLHHGLRTVGVLRQAHPWQMRDSYDG